MRELTAALGDATSGWRQNRRPLNENLQNWRDLLPLGGFAAIACVGLFFLLRKKPEDDSNLERERRAYLNRVGRIVEGQVLEFADHAHAAPESPAGKDAGTLTAKGASKDRSKLPAGSGLFAGNRSPAKGIQTLLYYTYSISGVTYETAQDITGLEERLHLSRVAAGQVASVKYDPSNPSNSILLADDWSGLQ